MRSPGDSVVTVSVSPSRSVSLSSTFREPCSSSVTTSESATAFGSSFTGVTVAVTSPASSPPCPSSMV